MVTKKDISEVMRELGKIKSEKKAKAVRESGKLGGRPRACRVCGSKMKRVKPGRLEYFCGKCGRLYLFKILLLVIPQGANLTARFLLGCVNIGSVLR